MLQLNNVVKRFGERLAVDDLSVEIHKGEIFGLLGPNGAGKSTTCHLISGLLSPERGQIQILGKSPSEPDARKQMGIAPQKIALYERLSARQNLRFFCSLYSMSKPQTEQSVEENLTLVGLADRADEAIKGFSGGMLRRLNLAAALLHSPSLVLLDEPTAGVDPQSRNRLFETVAHLKAQGKTVIYTTHYMEEAARLCDRVAIIDQGQLMALDSVPNLLNAHGGPSTISFMREGQQHQIQTPKADEALRELLQSSTPVSQLNVQAPTLESVFLKLTGKHLRD